MDKGITRFYRMDNGKPALAHYQVQGFFKEACGELLRLPHTRSHANKSAYKKVIDGLIFVRPDFIELSNDLGSVCQRPLRTSGPSGDRVALVGSETVPAGTTFKFEVECMNPKHEELVREWLNYGAYKGLGQWRNSGKGRFTWVEVKE